jgi:hypothetical protein
VLGIALAVGAGALAVGLSLRSSMRQKRLSPGDVAALERRLNATDDTEVAATLGVVFGDAAPAMIEALTEKSEWARRASAVALDELLGDLDRDLSSARNVAPAAIRVALLSSALGAIVELSGDLSGHGLIQALPAAAAGLGAAAICFELGRKSAHRGKRLRADWDRLSAASARRIGALGAEPVAFGRAGSARAGALSSRRPRNPPSSGSEGAGNS